MSIGMPASSCHHVAGCIVPRDALLKKSTALIEAAE
jgi:hypothetical protein